MAGRNGEDVLVSLLVAALLDKLTSPALREFGITWGVEDELGELSDVLESIHDMLDLLENAQRENKVIKRYLMKLRGEAYHMDNILDELAYEVIRERNQTSQSRRRKRVSDSLSFSLNSEQKLRQHEIAPLINQINEKLVEMEKKLEIHYLRSLEVKQVETIKKTDLRWKTSSLVDRDHILDRKKDVDAIRSKLLSSQHNNERRVSVVAIVGMGGLGKTTLSQLVYNHRDVQNHFQIRAWVCVSDNFDAERITKAILESAFMEPCELKELDPLQRELRKKLKGKKFLLVLDDVWSENHQHWEKLRVPFRDAKKGSRIIVTTRSKKTVSSIRDTIYTHNLEFLSDDDCWTLIKKCTFVDENSVASDLMAIGREIARKCKGLPLAANTLGGLLRSKLELQEWENILASDIWGLDKGNGLPDSLSLSYHYLPLHLKQCFVYSSLFPKDYVYDKECLVELWIAEGFVCSKENEALEDTGDQYFNDLLQRSFFQCASKEDPQHSEKFVMHELMHDLAESISGEICCRIESSAKSYSISKNTRHVALLDSYRRDSLNVKYYDSKSVSTLMVLKYGVMNHILNDLLENFRCLRVLDLRKTFIETLPDSIGNLKYLQYINLPYGLNSLPRGVGRLCCLKTLLPCFPVAASNGAGLRELKNLKLLEGSLCISGLHNVSDAIEATEDTLRNMSKLDWLVLEFDGQSDSSIDAEVLEALQPHMDLQLLHMYGYYGENFPNWMLNGFGCYNKLVSVCLFDCLQCHSLPALGELPSLKSMVLDHMPLLEEWPGAESGEFLCLEMLKIFDCKKLKELSPALGLISKLKFLMIYLCPSLMSLPEGLLNLTSLKSLNITHCSNTLTHLLDESLPPNLTHLKINYGVSESLPRALRNLSYLEKLKIYKQLDLTSSPNVEELKLLESLDGRHAYIPARYFSELPTNLRCLIVDYVDCTHHLPLHSQVQMAGG
ncbi:PREDICTED: putative disease resistance protein RGA1 [Nelumbo nucifera]|uniref:Disease resistance protein RGA1 n=2 Tax=Nelumbo nucifera TaxID=4432 RepID=A0A1U7Z4W3_NELNU|nr:PREDICTED: putative disease resistance protein RGA1 [Nelumbo nucifera]XP_010247303.1 PREDICTED: putative disease resistance protein RGA1 [Nelumbo nucifera]DAD39414.1 TPA_asm: hypothetical protein HUJ06_013737 [Nelumbo nucifera]